MVASDFAVARGMHILDARHAKGIRENEEDADG